MGPSKTKILMITVRSDMGGGPKHVFDLIKGLKSLSNEFELSIASPLNQPFGHKFREISEKHISIPARKFSFFKFVQILSFCKIEDIKIVHSHGRGAGIYSRLLSLFGIKVVHTFHGAHAPSGFIGSLKKNVDYFLRGINTKFICVSSDEKSQVLNLRWAHEKDISVIHNGIDVQSLRGLYENISVEDVKKKWSIPNKKIVLGTLARLTYQKGIDLLVNEILINRDVYSDYEFVIAGNGEEMDKISHFVNNHKLSNVHLIGEIDRPEELLKICDHYFSFSRWEGYPISVVEALSLKVNCILSNVVGHQDFKGCAQFFNLDQPGDFYRAIKTSNGAITNKNLNFDYIFMAKKVSDLYRSIL